MPDENVTSFPPSRPVAADNRESAEHVGTSLAAIVRALLDHRSERQKQGVPTQTPETEGVSLNDWLSSAARDWRREEATSMQRNPMEHVFTREIREIGWHVFVEGGKDMMYAVEREMRRALGDRLAPKGSDIIDKRWDGIGGPGDRWIA
jgi:hypothetical protein